MAHPLPGNDEDGIAWPGHPKRWWILGVLCLALSIIVIDETILYIAVPALFRDLGATNGQAQWAIDAYVIIYAALLLPAGNLGDRYGRRTFLLAGLVVFAAASLVAAWAPDPGVLIAARAVMAVGGALIMPQTLSIITEVFNPAQRGLAIGLWAGISGIGIVAGPVVGGLLIEHFWWGSIFLVNVPLIVLMLIAGGVLLPNHRDPAAAPADLPGSVAGVIALIGLIGAVIEYPGRGLADPIVWGSALIGLAAAVTFVAVENRRARPMFDLALLRVPRVVLSVSVIAGSFFALQGSSYSLTQYLQLLQGRGPTQVALIFAPFSLSWSIAAPFSARVVGRIGIRPVLVVTMTVAALGYVALAACRVGTPPWVLIVIFVAQGVAMGLSTTPLTDLLMGAVPRERAGVASAMNDISRQVGGAVGVAVFGAVIGALFASRLGASGPENLSRALQDSSADVAARASDAFMAGYRLSMVIGAALFVFVLPAVVRFGRPEGDPSPI